MSASFSVIGPVPPASSALSDFELVAESLPSDPGVLYARSVNLSLSIRRFFVHLRALAVARLDESMNVFASDDFERWQDASRRLTRALGRLCEFSRFFDLLGTDLVPPESGEPPAPIPAWAEGLPTWAVVVGEVE
jgi:hypothetical protein